MTILERRLHGRAAGGRGRSWPCYRATPTIDNPITRITIPDPHRGGTSRCTGSWDIGGGVRSATDVAMAHADPDNRTHPWPTVLAFPDVQGARPSDNLTEALENFGANLVFFEVAAVVVRNFGGRDTPSKGSSCSAKRPAVCPTVTQRADGRFGHVGRDDESSCVRPRLRSSGSTSTPYPRLSGPQGPAATKFDRASITTARSVDALNLPELPCPRGRLDWFHRLDVEARGRIPRQDEASYLGNHADAVGYGAATAFGGPCWTPTVHP
jgi:hypothetical protein